VSQEASLLRIMDIVEARGAGLPPSQTTYLAGDVGLDAAKSQKAIETVRQWREQGKLPFPDFSPETIARIDNKIEYPPPESALRIKKGVSRKRGIVKMKRWGWLIISLSVMLCWGRDYGAPGFAGR